MGNRHQARIRGDEEEHHPLTKGTVHQEDSMGENTYCTSLNTQFHKTSATGPDKTTVNPTHQLSSEYAIKTEKLQSQAGRHGTDLTDVCRICMTAVKTLSSKTDH